MDSDDSTTTGDDTTTESTTDSGDTSKTGSETQSDKKTQTRTDKTDKATNSGDTKSGDETSTGDTSKLQKALESERAARKEAEKKAKTAGDDAAARATAAEEKHQQTLDGIATALGFKKDDTPPDPSALQATISSQSTRIADLEQKVTDTETDRDAKLRARDVEIAAWRHIAAQPGIDAVTLMDLRSTERVLAGLDSTADDFTKSLDALVKDATTKNPALRIVREASPADAGIGTAGSSDAMAGIAPGKNRLAAYHSQTGSKP